MFYRGVWMKSFLTAFLPVLLIFAFLEKDRSFKFEDVRPGNYELRINVDTLADPDMKEKVIKKRIIVRTEDIKDNKLDLGDILIKEE